MIVAQSLTKVDLHRYDEAWERDALDVLPEVYGSPRSLQQSLQREINPKQHRVLDLRKAADFRAWHLPESINLPLISLGPHTPSPFSDPTMLEAQWVELEQIFHDDRQSADLGSVHVLVVCYDGDTARVATSVLRAKGVEADSVRGGYRALTLYGIGSERASGPTSTSTSAANSGKVPITTTVSVSAVPIRGGEEEEKKKQV